MFHKFTQGNGAFDKVTAATSRIGKSANETTLQVNKTSKVLKSEAVTITVRGHKHRQRIDPKS